MYAYYLTIAKKQLKQTLKSQKHKNPFTYKETSKKKNSKPKCKKLTNVMDKSDKSDIIISRITLSPSAELGKMYFCKS